VHLGSVGKRLSLAGLTTSGLIDKSGDVNRSTAPHLGNGGDDDGPTGDEYDNGGAGNVGETVASRSGSANTNGHLGYVVGRISLAGWQRLGRSTTGLGPEKSSGSRRRVVVSRSMYQLVESTTTEPETLMILLSTGYLKTLWDVTHDRVGPVFADEINGQAVMGLVVQGDAVSPSRVAEANVQPVVSTMGFAGLDEGNPDAGQHGQPGSPGTNNDLVPVLGVHGARVQGDADPCGLLRARWPTPTTVPGRNAVHLAREVSWSTRAGQRATPTMMGLTFRYPVRWALLHRQVSMGGQRQRTRATEGRAQSSHQRSRS